MKILLSLIISGALVVSGFGQTRNVLVGTNNAVVQPTNFWSADASNARVGLGLGTAATNPASAFQSSSSVLSNLASSNAVDITNIRSTNIVGVLSVSQGGTGATNAADARISIGLGSAATNPSSAFQSSSSALSNLSLNNGASLTNIQAANIVGAISFSNIPSFNFTNIDGTLSVAKGGTGSTNAANARQNLGSTTLGDAVFTATNAAAARTVIGATTVGSSVFTLANPSAITFLRLNADNTASALSASDFRTAIGLGSSATNASSAFQPASSMLTNLASSNAFYLSNIQASNITGLLGLTNGGTGADNAINARANLGLGSASTNPAAAFQPSSGNLTNLAANNGANLTNIPLSAVIGALATNGNASNLTNFPTSLLTTNGNGFGLTNLNASNITGLIPSSNISSITISNLTGTLAIASGGTGATNASVARTNLGLGATWLTNTNAGAFLSAINGQSSLIDLNVSPSTQVGRGHNDGSFVAFGSMGLYISGGLTNINDEDVVGNLLFYTLTNSLSESDGVPQGTWSVHEQDKFRNAINLGATWLTNTSATNFRSAIGLGWSALTNTNAGTGLVSVNTNGTVVSPTNFWQVAPIQTLVQDLTVVVTSQTNNATNARNLYVYSLATNVTGISNTIILPTNAATFEGDEATVVHQGTTNTTTVIRQAGSTNNLITLNRFDEAVKFIRESGQWNFYHNISYVEPIQFSGTNAVASAGGSRTNLGIGWSVFTNTDTTNFHTAIFNTNTTPTNAANLGNAVAWVEMHIITNGATNSFRIPLFK